MTDLRSILLAEDDQRDVELILEALTEYRLANAIAVVRDGREALDYLYRHGSYKHRPPGLPAVVLLDIKMPKVDGLEVLRRLKEDPHLSTVPIVMLTSSREESDLIRGYALGANAFVVKPVDFTAFLECIRQLGAFWAILNEPPAASRIK